MEILEKRDEWKAHFDANWLKSFQETGKVDWKLYQYSRNELAPSGPAIDLSKSKLMFVTTAGAYLRDSQEVYDAENDLGDYSIRTFPQSTALDKLAYAQTHYNHKWVDDDPQSLVPLRLLEAMVAEGKIGSLAETVVAFGGYMPDVTIVVDELVPQVIGMAKEQQVDAVLLVPA